LNIDTSGERQLPDDMAKTAFEGTQIQSG
jgi:hypothetical protein